MSSYPIRTLTHELVIPADGKQSKLLSDDADAKVILFAFAAGAGLPEHVAPLAVIIQVIQGTIEFTVEGHSQDRSETQVGTTGTWLKLPPQLKHSVKATTPALMLLTLLK